MAREHVKQMIDLNMADVEELARIKIIGKKRAQALVDYRDENGPFEDWEDIKNVEGFSESLIEDLKESGATLGDVEAEGEEEEW